MISDNSESAVTPIEHLTIVAAPGLFVILWASGFIGAKLGLPYAEPLTFLFWRMFGAVLLLGAIAFYARPRWPDRTGLLDSCAIGTFMHALYLGGVYISIANGLLAAISALIVGLQPLLTSTIANRLLGERVVARQWGGLLLGIAGVYLVVQDRATTGGATPLAWVAALVALLSITFGTIYQKRRESAETAGVFGVPTFIVEGELFWGREHLADIREKLATLARKTRGDCLRA